MKIKTFLKDKLLFIALTLFVAGFSAFLLYMVNADTYFILFVPCVYFLGALLTMAIEFLIKNNYYNQLNNNLETLDRKCLLSEIIERPSFSEGKILYDTLKVVSKSMNDEIAKQQYTSLEYQEYIELWVHEVKTPIAGAKLICENIEHTNLLAEIEKIDKLIEQALFYSRSSNVEKDFIVRQVELRDIIHSILKKNAKQLIEHKINIELCDIEGTAYTDTKWTYFILQQLIDNAVKYQCNRIKIHAETKPNSISLYVSDNGVGIPMQDIKRVFDKGFTGENGRKFGRSTGIGLYLCKKMCTQLGLNILIKSEQKAGTEVEIVFPINSLLNITKM